MNKKAYLGMSFQWIFALIVGAFILVLTIYGVTRFTEVEQGKQDIQKAQQLENLLNPLETSFETATSVPITTNVMTRIQVTCDSSGELGEQGIKIQQKNLNEIPEDANGRSVKSKNRYIFLNKSVEGKKFYIFSKPFNFPFKVGDLIYITSDKSLYCFQNPPENVKKDLDGINQSNIITGCSQEELGYRNVIKVCFIESGSSSPQDCDIKVFNYNGVNSKLEKNNQEVFFSNDALMYAGIFSDVENYECQLKRLIKREQKLSSLYIEKSNMISHVCSNNELKPLLIILKTNFENYNNSGSLRRSNNLVEEIKNKNEGSWECRLW
ncbi:MAG TPA: hypothetical protein VJ912_02860 [Candidatus Nanoarchaeia archaeon]|nr:hypothetical protein [Candidatus Nanoarchaeia archaeon]